MYVEIFINRFSIVGSTSENLKCMLNHGVCTERTPLGQLHYCPIIAYSAEDAARFILKLFNLADKFIFRYLHRYLFVFSWKPVSSQLLFYSYELSFPLTLLTLSMNARSFCSYPRFLGK